MPDALEHRLVNMTPVKRAGHSQTHTRAQLMRQNFRLLLMGRIGPIGAAIAAVLTVSAVAQDSSDGVSEQRLRADVQQMVGFGTRHTLSAQDDPQRGIGTARRWAEAKFRKTSKGCDDCLEIVLPETQASGTRIPTPVRLVNVVAIQRGIERPDEVVIVQGHLDSRVTDVMDATSDAPGANDNASGSALVLESARILSKQRFPSTIVYALLSGEEQGLYGGKLLADYAEAQGWKVKAVLNNDIVGGSRGSDGIVDNRHVRVFSEGPRADATDKTRADARRYGGENDSPSRNLSRFIAGIAADSPSGLKVRQVWRADRLGRGGDQLPFQGLGFPAIRFSVAIENYDHQHQDLRVENGVAYGDTINEMDFPYLAGVTRINVATLAALAKAPMPPEATVEAAVQPFTVIKWKPSKGASTYRIWRRRTDAAVWSDPVDRPAGATELRLDGIRGDDWLFGVSAKCDDGSESPVASAVPGGAFAPIE